MNKGKTLFPDVCLQPKTSNLPNEQKSFSSAKKNLWVLKMFSPAIGLSQTNGFGVDFHFQITVWCGRNLLLESHLLGTVQTFSR